MGVRTQAPMKRGLKRLGKGALRFSCRVRTQAPMKRGLKLESRPRGRAFFRCPNPGPDEEGIETTWKEGVPNWTLTSEPRPR